uniref:Tc1-like transposase DDE domain-containing protein n=2 Tax=Photinus pyralis TaxID=7054 RepID=A0A1Y1NHR6_PHOPY
MGKNEPRRGLMELPHVASKRIRFLRQYKDFKEKDLYQFVFLDETLIFQNGTIQRSWQDSNGRSVKTIKTDGKRQIILHAGNEKGFIPSSGDYHGEMKQTNFLHWFQNQLLPNLSEPSVINFQN